MAARLSKAFGGSAESWLSQQALYDLARVRADSIKLRRLALLWSVSRLVICGRIVPKRCSTIV